MRTLIVPLAHRSVGVPPPRPPNSSDRWPGRSFADRADRASPKEQKPPIEVGPDKNVKWKIAVPSGSSSPIVVGDLLGLHGIRRRQTLHDRLHPRRWQRSLAGRSAGQRDRALPHHRRQPRRLDAGNRRQANHLLLWIVRAVLLRPGGQGAVEVRTADRGHAVRFRQRAFRPSWPMAWWCWCGMKTKIPKSWRSTWRRASCAGRKIARIEIGLLHPCRLRHARAARKSWRRAWGKMIGYDLKTGDGNWCVVGMPSCAPAPARSSSAARSSSPAGRPATT